MKNYLIATIKSWNIHNYLKLKKKDMRNNWYIVSDKIELKEKLDSIRPEKIFFPHWSWIIPKNIYKSYDCIVFHATDLPFGRGGSPIGNLLERGIYNTKISAIKVDEGTDTGPIYLKKEIDISKGNINDILKKCSDIIFNFMIPYIIENNPMPKEQRGKVVTFKRRTPEMSNMLKANIRTKRTIYDFIRMLDGEGYPRAFIPLKNGKIELYEAKIDEKQNRTIFKGEYVDE